MSTLFQVRAKDNCSGGLSLWACRRADNMLWSNSHPSFRRNTVIWNKKNLQIIVWQLFYCLNKMSKLQYIAETKICHEKTIWCHSSYHSLALLISAELLGLENIYKNNPQWKILLLVYNLMISCYLAYLMNSFFWVIILRIYNSTIQSNIKYITLSAVFFFSKPYIQFLKNHLTALLIKWRWIKNHH